MSTTKKSTAKPAAEPKTATNGHAKKSTPLNQPLPEGMLGTKEVAAKLKITPRHLRVVLRSMGKGTGGERYMWKDGSPELAKIAEAVKAQMEEPTEKK
jgi:hypothetical protein